MKKMKEDTIKYNKTQTAYWLFLIPIIASLFIFTQPSTTTSFFVVILLTLIVIVFHKLTITINDAEILAHFNFGLFKRRMKISDIELTSIELIKINWFNVMGVGMRYTSKGWLYNVRLGEAIRIVSKDDKKIFFVGIENGEYEKIKQVMSTEPH